MKSDSNLTTNYRLSAVAKIGPLCVQAHPYDDETSALWKHRRLIPLEGLSCPLCNDSANAITIHNRGVCHLATHSYQGLIASMDPAFTR